MFPSQVVVGPEDSSVLSLAIERHGQEKVGSHYPNIAQAQMVKFISITHI